MSKDLVVHKALTELGVAQIVDISSSKAFVFQPEPGSVYLVGKYFICAAVVLVGLNRFTGGGTSLLDSHTVCYTLQDDSLGNIC